MGYVFHDVENQGSESRGAVCGMDSPRGSIFSLKALESRGGVRHKESRSSAERFRDGRRNDEPHGQPGSRVPGSRGARTTRRGARRPGDGASCPRRSGFTRASPARGSPAGSYKPAPRESLAARNADEAENPKRAGRSRRDRPTATSLKPPKSRHARLASASPRAKDKGGRGAAREGGADARSVRRRGDWMAIRSPPSDPGTMASGSKRHAQSSRAGRGLLVAPGSPDAATVDRTRGRGGESSGGAKAQESNGPDTYPARWRKPARRTRDRENGLLEGSKASKRAFRRRNGDPGGSRRSHSTACAATRARTGAA